MINTIIMGAAGRMGKRLVALVQESENLTLSGAVEWPGHPAVGRDAGEEAGSGRAGIDIHDTIDRVIAESDVIVDFTAPRVTLSILEKAIQHQKAMVIGTTGMEKDDLQTLNNLAPSIPCVFAPNMSIGINVLLNILGRMVNALGSGYDIEVIEAHHNKKKDAPSGTALKLAEVLAQAANWDIGEVGVFSRHGMIGERGRREIGVQTIRAGDIVGDHTVLFGGQGERIEIIHRAQNRDTFARGALRAAEWVVKQPPGLYHMAHVLGLAQS